MPPTDATDPTAPTDPGPASLDVQLDRGALRVTVADVAEITLDVTGKAGDVDISRSSDGRRVVVEPVRRLGRHPHLDISARVPRGTELWATTASAAVTVAGELRRASISTASADVRLDDVVEDVEVSSASGSLRAGRIGGPLSYRSASGSVEVERVGGACSARSVSGSVTIGLAGSDATAKTVSGSIAVREAHQGTLDLSATSGRVSVGVRRGTLTWLDVSSLTGRVRSDLADDAGDDTGGGPLLTVRASNVSGDITISSTGTPAIAL